MSKKNSKEPSGLTKRISKLSIEEKTMTAIATVHTEHIARARREFKKCGMKWIHDFPVGSEESLALLKGTEASYDKVCAIKAPWFRSICRDGLLHVI